MGVVAGSNSGYMKEIELKAIEKLAYEKAFDIFKTIATMGSVNAIKKSEDKLKGLI